MSLGNSFFRLFRKLKVPRDSSFGLDISLALLVKFLLLAALWWVFFAGNKRSVDEWVIAEKTFGEPRPVVQLQKNQEKP